MIRNSQFSAALNMTALSATILLGCSSTMLATSPAVAAAPMVGTQAPGFYRMKLGGCEITAINDGTVPLDVEKPLAEPAAATRSALEKSFESNPLETSDNTFLVNWIARWWAPTICRSPGWVTCGSKASRGDRFR